MRHRGRVKWYSAEKGYGFIIPDNGGEDCFVHRTGIRGGNGGPRQLQQGADVEYEVKPGTKGPNAIDVVAVAIESGAYRA